jgi:fatty acid amide hydrolase 2
MDVFKLSANEITQSIFARKISCQEVLAEYVKKIQFWNGELNALVASHLDRAVLAAKKWDDSLASLTPETHPWLGVPFSAKDMFFVEGLRCTCGSIHRKDFVGRETAPLIQKMMDQGGLFLGLTNVPEFGFWFETDNPVYGKTSNPFDLSRTAGGSSGGEGALIACRGSVVGLGSDIGGSIRIPAAFCGLAGHKPSRFLIPLTGHYPATTELMRSGLNPYPLTTVGPMARKVADLCKAMELWVGPDGFDSRVKSDFRLPPALDDFSGLKVFVWPSPVFDFASLTDEEISQAVVGCGQYAEALGAKVVDLPKEWAREFAADAVSLWFYAISLTKERSFLDQLTQGQDLSFGLELVRSFVGSAQYSLVSLITAGLEKFVPGVLKVEDASKKAERLSKALVAFRELLSDHAVILMPTHPRVAPKHGHCKYRPFDFIYTGVANSMELAATQIPVGLSPGGLPIGVQVMAGPGQDHLALSLAQALELGFGEAPEPKGWVRKNL